MEDDREDGELSDSDSNTCDDVNVYNPVVRPNSNTCRPRNVCPSIPSSASSEEQSSSSDSDSDIMSRPKRPKFNYSQMKMERNKIQSSALDNGARKKNNIWANVLQEEELTLEIGGVGLKKLKGDRNVESYDYEQAKVHRHDDIFEDNEEETEESIKRRQMRKRRFHDNFSEPKKSDKQMSKPRILSSIDLDQDWDNNELGCAIANALYEQKPELIVRVVDVLGQEKALELYTKTKDVEKEGGMLIFNGSRRRTSGGVYLQLLKSLEGVEKSHLSQIFCEDTKESQQWRKRKRMNRKRHKHKSGGSDKTEEDGLNLKGLFSDDPGGTKCPGSTPVTSPTASDSEEEGAISNAKSTLLPMKEVCEKVASEITHRSQDIDPSSHKSRLKVEEMETC